MPIKDDENVRVLEFGSGDIIVAPAMLDDKLNSVIFVQDTICREIGSVNTHGVIGKSHRELDTKVVMHFSNIESLDVVITALKEVRKYFDEKVELQEEVAQDENG